MSLDVYLTLKEVVDASTGTGIFIRENGQTKEISQSEWDEKFPGVEPVVIKCELDDSEVYTANITHNLGKMAAEAQIYECLWRPDEIGATKAKDLIAPLTDGVELLRSDPDRFKIHNPTNGWGDYDGLVVFVTRYLCMCERYPNAEVDVSR